MSIIMPAE